MILIIFLVLTITTIPILSKKTEQVLRVNLEIEDITTLPTTSVFLLNKENLLVKTNIFMTQQEEKIPYIIDYLKEDNKNIKSNLNGYLSKNTKLLNYQLDGDTLYLDFSKELLTKDKQKNDKIITGLVYSLLEIEEIKNISITIEKEPLKDYPKILNKNIGINNEYKIKKRNDIQKVVIYYLDQENNYLPITKYINDKRNKIEIIIEELKNSERNKISPLNTNTKLLDYREEENVCYLNFNEYLLDQNEDTKNKTLNTIAYSIFENYEVNMVMFEVENQEIEYRKK